MRMRNDLILVVGLSVSLAGIATATERCNLPRRSRRPRKLPRQSIHQLLPP